MLCQPRYTHPNVGALGEAGRWGHPGSGGTGLPGEQVGPGARPATPRGPSAVTPRPRRATQPPPSATGMAQTRPRPFPSLVPVPVSPRPAVREALAGLPEALLLDVRGQPGADARGTDRGHSLPGGTCGTTVHACEGGLPGTRQARAVRWPGGRPLHGHAAPALLDRPPRGSRVCTRPSPYTLHRGTHRTRHRSSCMHIGPKRCASAGPMPPPCHLHTIRSALAHATHVHGFTRALTLTGVHSSSGGTTSVLTLGAAVLGSPGPGPSQHCAPQESPRWGLVSPSEDMSPALMAGVLTADSVPLSPGSRPHALCKHKPVSGGPPPNPGKPSLHRDAPLVGRSDPGPCAALLCAAAKTRAVCSPLLGVRVAVALWGDDGTAMRASGDIMGRAPEVTPLGKLSLSQPCPLPRVPPGKGRGVTWGARLPPVQSCWVSAWDPRSLLALSPAAQAGPSFLPSDCI